MTRTDLLKLRIKKFVTIKQLRILADDYLPETSNYRINPKLSNNKAAIIDEMNILNTVENNYDAILSKVNLWLG